jgi:hypothetical protein
MPVSRLTRRFLVRLLVCAAALMVPSAALADCAHDIIDQAYKGKITGTYSQACYNAAIKIEPVDGSSYSDLDSVIKSAKHVAALAAESKATSTPTTTTETPRTQVAKTRATTTAPPVSTVVTTKAETAIVGGGRVAPATHTGSATTPSKPTATVSTTPAAPEATLLGAPSATPVLDRLAPAHADQVPVAVIVLGVLAALLVLAGVAGAVLRRRAGRSTT